MEGDLRKILRLFLKENLSRRGESSWWKYFSEEGENSSWMSWSTASTKYRLVLIHPEGVGGG
jgi:hypothetical protein